MKLLGVEVFLLRGLSGARRRWCGEFTAAQRTCAGGEKRKVWLGFGRGGCDGDEAQREARARFKGSGAGDCGAQLRKWIPGSCAGDLECGRCAEQKRKEEEDPDLWANAGQQ